MAGNKQMKTLTIDGTTYDINDKTARSDIQTIQNGIGEIPSGKSIEGQISEINETLESKANVDGYYENMSVGNAEQLISDVIQEDKVPFVFRPAGGSLEIGTRMFDELVGGSLNWNQYVQNGDFSSSSGWASTSPYGSLSVSDGIATLTSTEQNNGFNTSRPVNAGVLAGHKMFVKFSAKSTVNTMRTMGGMYGAYAFSALTAGEWTVVEGIGSATTTSDHSWAVLYPENSSSGLAVGESVQFKNFVIVDLTALFGSTIADYLYTLETATPGAGIARLKSWGLFQKDYYPYKAVTMEHVQVSAHETVEFNQWDEEWETGSLDATTGENKTNTSSIRSKNFIPIPDASLIYYLKTSRSGAYVFCYNADKAYLGRLGKRVSNDSTQVANHPFYLAPGTAYVRFYVNDGGSYSGGDICLDLSWDQTRDGEYEPYKKHTYTIDPVVLRGIPKKDDSGNLYFDGDSYKSDGTVTRRYAVVDLGTLTWEKQTGTQTDYFQAYIIGIKHAATTNTPGNLLCTRYLTTDAAHVSYSAYPKSIGVSSTSDSIYVQDLDYSTATDFKAAVSGVMLLYELAEPTTEQADPFQNPQIVDNFGTERYVDYAYEQGNRDFEFPGGHRTEYQLDCKAKIEAAPDSPDADGVYVMQRINGQNSYTPLIVDNELPDNPTTDGTYSLKVTVSDGSATLAWAAD